MMGDNEVCAKGFLIICAHKSIPCPQKWTFISHLTFCELCFKWKPFSRHIKSMGLFHMLNSFRKISPPTCSGSRL